MQEKNPDDKKTGEKTGGLPAEKKQSATVKKRNLKPLYLFTAFIILLLVAGNIYLYLQMEKTRQVAEQAQQNATTQQSGISQQLEQLDRRISEISDAQDELGEAMSEIQQEQPEDNEDWALAEVEYLLIIASHRLILEHDVDTALAAMEAAASRLKDMSGPELLPVREQVTADINRLRAVNKVDTAGLAIYLADLIDRAEDLPLRKPEVDQQKNAAAGEKEQADKSGSGWRDMAGVIWHELKSLIIIKKSGEIRQALLLPDEEYFLSQNLKLELENARFAVLRHDTENLHTSIDLLLDWLGRYYDTADAGVGNVVDTLQKMQTLELQPKLPDISSSLETLRAYMREE